MADALQGTWVFNESVALTLPGTTIYFDFTSYNINFTQMTVNSDGLLYGLPDIYGYRIGSGWVNDSYRTIEITSTFEDMVVSSGVTKEEFLTWLQANATKVPDTPTCTYTVKSSDGATDLATVSAYPTVSAELTAVDNTRVLLLTDADGTVTSASWTTSDPPGTTFLGLAYSANATEPDVPVDEVITVDWSSDTTLYEVYMDLYTCTVKSSDGATELATVSAYPTVSAELAAVGNTRVLILTDADGTDTSASWTTSDPPGTTFLGLAYSANATEPDVPVDEVITVDWSSDTTLYEVYMDLYTCTVKSSDGATELATVSAYPTVSAELAAVGNTRVLILTDADGTDTSASWTTQDPPGTTFLGLAYSANATEPDVPVDEVSTVDWRSDTTLYEVYIDLYTYTVKTSDGATVLATVSASPTVSTELTAVGNTRALFLTDADGAVTSVSWTTSDPPGTTFLGLAYSANATEPDVPVDEVSTVDWSSDTTLYEVYTDLYDNRCTVSTWNGSEILAALARLPDIRSALITAIGRARALTLTDHNGAQYALSWTTPTPRGATLLGLAYEPDASSADVPTDLNVEVNWTGDRTLYEVYEDLYDNVYTVKSSNGLKTLATLSEAPGMVSAQLYTVGNVKTLTLTGDNGAVYSLPWSSESPEGKTFYGLGFRPGEWDPELVTGTSITVDWSDGFTLYEVYRTYKPPSTPFDINLYKCSAEPNRLDKTDYLERVGTLSGALRDECSIIRPSITFKYEGVPLFNYVYIAKFERWYFVTGMTSVSKDLWRMELNCDVLHTYKDQIRPLWAIIARQEYDYSLMVNDPEILALSERAFTVIPSSLSPIDQSTVLNSYVLTVVGRGGT